MSAESWKDGEDLARELSQPESSSRVVMVLGDASRLLESQAIHWRRDFDAIAVGFVLGVLATLAVQGVW